MSEHAQPRHVRRRTSPLATLGTVVVFAALLGAVAERANTSAASTVPDLNPPDPSWAPVYAPSGLTEADRAPVSLNAPTRTSQGRTAPSEDVMPTQMPTGPMHPPMGPPTPTPTPTPTRPTAKPSHASTGDDKDPLRKGLDEVFPPLRDLPSWSLPIVDNVQQHAVKGTVVQARVDEHGTLYVCGTVKADDALLHHQGHGRHRPKPGKHAAASTGVEVMLRVEDPTTATPANPATVTVTALARHASTPVVTTTQITDPTTATDDAVRAVDDAVTDAAAVAPDPMPDPTPTDGEQIFTGLTLGGQMALGPDGGVIQLGPPEPLDDVDQVEPTDPPTTP